jgi:hypothetical protein
MTGGRVMCPARSILAVLFFLSSLGGANPGFAFDDSPSMATKAENSPAFQSLQVNVVGQVASALAGGSEAMRALRGSPDEYDQKDRLEPPLPGMNCGVDRILSYVSCYSAVINNAEEAENVFQQLVDDVKAALPSDRWGPVQAIPRPGSVRSISYQDGKTAAKIDIELLVISTMEGHSSYVISLYGWTRI